MQDERITVLLIEDNPGDARLVGEMLARQEGAGVELECVNRLSAALERLAQGGVDVVLADLSLPDSWGLDSFARAHAEAPDVPIIVLSGWDDKTIALRAMQEGAHDYLVKGEFDGAALVCVIRSAVEGSGEGQQNG